MVYFKHIMQLTKLKRNNIEYGKEELYPGREGFSSKFIWSNLQGMVFIVFFI